MFFSAELLFHPTGFHSWAGLCYAFGLHKHWFPRLRDPGAIVGNVPLERRDACRSWMRCRWCVSCCKGCYSIEIGSWSWVGMRGFGFRSARSVDKRGSSPWARREPIVWKADRAKAIRAKTLPSSASVTCNGIQLPFRTIRSVLLALL